VLAYEKVMADLWGALRNPITWREIGAEPKNQEKQMSSRQGAMDAGTPILDIDQQAVRVISEAQVVLGDARGRAESLRAQLRDVEAEMLRAESLLKSVVDARDSWPQDPECVPGPAHVPQRY